MTSDFAPLYRRIKDTILVRIASGEWRPGDRIPSENELVDELHASRMTVNRAFRELAAEGRIVRTPGVGTFVAADRVEPEVVEIPPLAGTGLKTRVLSQSAFQPKPEAARTFGIEAGARLLRVELLHLAGGEPIALEDRIFNLDLLPDCRETDFAAVAPNAYLAQRLPLARSGLAIEATAASPALLARLRLGPNEPCLVIERRVSVGGVLASFARIYHPAARFRLEGGYSNRSASIGFRSDAFRAG